MLALTEPPWFFTHIFPWGFIIAGGSYGFDAIRTTLRAHASRSWPTVQGLITHCVVKEDSIGESSATLRTPSIEYTYTVEGRSFQGNRLSVADSPFTSDSQIQKFRQELATGKSVTVFYCPSDPQWALLQPGIRLRLIAKVLFSLLALLLGLAFLVVPQWVRSLPADRG